MSKGIELVCGVGVNDAGYVVSPTINGKQTPCPFYKAWKGMLVRCYSKNFQFRSPTYTGCSVASEWLIFSAFKDWMGNQIWQGLQLDKDLLIAGNKVYSPDTCVFVDQVTNYFINECSAARGSYPLGVNWHKGGANFIAKCSNPFTGKRENLGSYSCPEQAHKAWLKRKHELALLLAELQSDERAAAALRVRYSSARGQE